MATGLWFLATLCMYELGWALFGLPRVMGPLLAAGVASFVALDPLHVLWAVRNVDSPRLTTANASTLRARSKA